VSDLLISIIVIVVGLGLLGLAAFAALWIIVWIIHAADEIFLDGLRDIKKSLDED